MRYYIFLAISIVLNSASLILLKKGALVAKNDGLILRDPGTWLQLLGNLHIYLSLTAFALATITWLFALTKIDLSVAYPSVSISYIIIAIASIYIFGEIITLNRWIGMVMIATGVIVMYIR